MRPFEAPAGNLGSLSAQDAANLIAMAADVALILDDDGVICDLAFGNDELSRGGYADWLGKPWAETVTIESRPKVEALLRDASRPLEAATAPKWRHINHPSPAGADLPLLYAALPVREGGHPGSRGRSIAFGRDLRPNMVLQQQLISAQQSMERDYWRLRHMETRYRSLFQQSSEAVLIVEATSLKLEEANPSALRLFGEGARRPGWSLLDSFAAEGRSVLQLLLTSVRSSGGADTRTVRLASGDADVAVSVSLFRQEKSSHFLIRLVPLHGDMPAPSSSGKQMLLKLVESAPDAFVVTDPDGRILTVNRAFLDLAQLTSDAQAVGESLEKWLGRTGVDLSVLINNLRQRGAVRLFATSMRGEYGSTSEVEISAVAAVGTVPPCLGFTIRDVGRRLMTDSRAAREMPRSVGQMTELVGRVPLKDIVRDTTDLIEQLCIEAALELTRDNRASAAEMLGLSRQSLYVKLRRYGLRESVADGPQ